MTQTVWQPLHHALSRLPHLHSFLLQLGNSAWKLNSKSVLKVLLRTSRAECYYLCFFSLLLIGSFSWDSNTEGQGGPRTHDSESRAILGSRNQLQPWPPHVHSACPSRAAYMWSHSSHMWSHGCVTFPQSVNTQLGLPLACLLSAFPERSENGKVSTLRMGTVLPRQGKQKT